MDYDSFCAICTVVCVCTITICATIYRVIRKGNNFMTQAEKARAYDEAIKRAKEINSEQKAQPFDVMLKVFPELKESEDEKIRKAISQCVEDMRGQFEKLYSVHHKDAIAWLEKQGKQPICKTPSREIILAIWDLGNEWKELTKGSISTEYGTQLDYIQKHWQESEYYLRAKQSEQKPADKVKPKFHEGDWITNGDYTWKIVEVKPLDYILQSQDGNIVDDTISHVDEQFHSFTIEDAKDGDVLVIQKTNVSYESIFIFNKIENNRIIQYLHYFTTDADEEVCEARTADGFLGFVGTTVHPATKEQRDTLLKAMADAGYKWDSENKMLLSLKAEPNSEQKPAWSEEDEEYLNFVIAAMKTLQVKCTENEIKHHSNSQAVPYYAKVINWLKSLMPQPKQKWSEEDEENFRDIIGAIHRVAYQTSEDEEARINWLKSIKDRVQP